MPRSAAVTPNFADRTLFIDDNLTIMRGMNSESVDLIATDPPFNKGVKAFTGVVKAGYDQQGEPVSYSDIWTWGDVQQEWIEAIAQDHPALYRMIESANATSGDDMGAYLCWLAVRVLEMHRILKPTGSLLLHCDDTASHYIRAMLDAIFGSSNYLNEIIWKRRSGGSPSKKLSRIHDTIFYYGRSKKRTWNPIQIPHDDRYISSSYKITDGRGTYSRRNGDLMYNGRGAGEAALPWRGIDPSARGRAGRHWHTPTKGSMCKFIQDHNLIPDWPEGYPSVHQRLDALDKAELLYFSKSGIPRLKIYLEALGGQDPGDIFLDIPNITRESKEGTGYPTQKPLALYRRLVEATTNRGDIVLDPFAGCATTCVAAEQLERTWVAIDVNEEAKKVIYDRLNKEVREQMAWFAKVTIATQPPRRTDGGEEAAPELTSVRSKPSGPRLSVKDLRSKLLMRDGQRCQGCGWEPHYPDYLEADHKKPSSLGGPDALENRALLCNPCNRTKSNKLTLTQLRQKRVQENRMNATWWDNEQWR